MFGKPVSLLSCMIWQSPYCCVCYFQETLLVHKDLANTVALNELIVDLRIEGTVYSGICFFLASNSGFIIFYSLHPSNSEC